MACLVDPSQPYMEGCECAHQISLGGTGLWVMGDRHNAK